jgi:hypothetical protein
VGGVLDFIDFWIWFGTPGALAPGARGKFLI